MKTATLFLLPVSMAVAAALPASAPPSHCVSKDRTHIRCNLEGTFIGVKVGPPTNVDKLTGQALEQQYRHVAPNNTRPFKQPRSVEASYRLSVQQRGWPNTTIKYEAAEKKANNTLKVGEEDVSKAAGKVTERLEAENKDTVKSVDEQEDKEARPVRILSVKISGDEVVQRLKDVQTLIPKLEKVFRHFGIEGSGMRPDRQKAKNFKNIQSWLGEWTEKMQDLENHLEATRTWDIVEQMKVAQQYFKYAYDVKNMLQSSRKHVSRFDKSSHMRCEVATSLARLNHQYVIVANHLYNIEQLTHSHEGGRLLRSKFGKPLPMWWDLAYSEPWSGEIIGDWIKWNDKAFNPTNGQFVKSMDKWGDSVPVGRCDEMEPHGD